MDPNSLARRTIVLAVLLLVYAGVASAADEQLLAILLENGAIDQAQYDQLIVKEELTEKDVRDVIVKLDGKGLTVATSDGAYKFNLGGRLHADASGHSGSGVASEATDGTEVRRARMYFQGTLWQDYFFQTEADFADNEVSVKDFFVGYQGLPWGTFIVGHQKQPFSLAVEMSSNDLPFIERGTDTDLIIPFIDRAIGVRGDFHGEHWQVAAGIYGDSVDADKNDGEGWGSTGRFVWAPLRGEDRVLHLGARGAFRDPNDNQVRIRSETTHMSNLFLVDTGTLNEVERLWLTGPEAAVAFGPFSIGGEYNHVFLDRNEAPDVNFNSWHVEATWSLTGESRAASYAMKSGEFKGLKPGKPFSLEHRDLGAWELAVRYAAIDLDDEDVDGGRQGIFTAALNWYLTSGLRVMFDYSRVLDENSPLGNGKGLNIFQSRVDVHF